MTEPKIERVLRGDKAIAEFLTEITGDRWDARQVEKRRRRNGTHPLPFSLWRKSVVVKASTVARWASEEANAAP